MLWCYAAPCCPRPAQQGSRLSTSSRGDTPRPPIPAALWGVSGRALGPGDPDRLMGDSGLCPSAGKGAAPRPSSTSPFGVLKAPAQQDPVYASIDEGKETQTLEPDPGTDGLTYAELDGQALQAKRGDPAPAPEPAQPSVYAAINVSQGAPQ
ncbi:uncharacterized protein RBU57_017582 [Macrochelys suwanniensis]